MKPFAILLALLFCSCTVVKQTTDPQGNRIVSGYMLGTDADAMVIDGPPPTVLGFQPIMNKKGVVVGSRPVYGVAPEAAGQRALFAAYGMNNSKAFGKAANVVTTTALGMVAAGVQKAKDSATAANEAKQIDAASKASSESAALAAQQEANRSKEAIMGMELSAGAAAPTP